MPSIVGQDSGCSTPFGIYEVGTKVGVLYLFTRGMCSTPFGIYEVGTADGIDAI